LAATRSSPTGPDIAKEPCRAFAELWLLRRSEACVYRIYAPLEQEDDLTCRREGARRCGDACSARRNRAGWGRVGCSGPYRSCSPKGASAGVSAIEELPGGCGSGRWRWRSRAADLCVQGSRSQTSRLSRSFAALQRCRFLPPARLASSWHHMNRPVEIIHYHRAENAGFEQQRAASYLGEGSGVRRFESVTGLGELLEQNMMWSSCGLGGVPSWNG